jgi:hypothetical protein
LTGGLRGWGIADTGGIDRKNSQSWNLRGNGSYGTGNGNKNTIKGYFTYKIQERPLKKYKLKYSLELSSCRVYRFRNVLEQMKEIPLSFSFIYTKVDKNGNYGA